MRAIGVVCLLAGSAHAGNEDSFLFGGQAALTGGAVTATTEDTAAVWYNPAGLGSNHHGRIEASGTAFTLRLRPIPDRPRARSAGASRWTSRSRALYVVPAGLGLAKALSTEPVIGAGLFVTEQDLFNYKADVVPSDSTVDLDVAGALTGTLIRYHAGLGVGYRRHAAAPHRRDRVRRLRGLSRVPQAVRERDDVRHVPVGVPAAARRRARHAVRRSRRSPARRSRSAMAGRSA